MARFTSIVLEETAEVYGQWPSLEDFLNSFVEA